LTKTILGVALCCLLCCAKAAEPDPDVEYLLLRVQDSACEFERNGSKYTGVEAARHLRRKVAAARTGTVDVERFITQIASHSSISGRPYLVRCPGASPEPSAVWLQRLLRERPA
jgi:hypothetical protein